MSKKSKLLIDGKTFYKQKMLGRGAYGKVFKVTDDNGAFYAIKRVDYNEKDGVYPDIIKEMDFLRRFSAHPNIIELCGYKWDNQTFTALMEFGGIPMHKFIDIYRYEYRMEMLPEILWQLLVTLAYIHRHKTCHRDIKPDNILIEEIFVKHSNKRFKPNESPRELDDLMGENDLNGKNDPRGDLRGESDSKGESESMGENDPMDENNPTDESGSENDIEICVKLCDFGLSKTLMLKRNTPKTSTLWYRSPENLAELKEYSTKIDIWALGCVIYEYVTDEVLFEANTTKDTLIKVFRTLGPISDRDLTRLQIDKNTLPKKWKRHTMIDFEDKQLWDLMMQCLIVNPENRPSAENLLKHEYFTSKGYSFEDYQHDLEDFTTKDESYDSIVSLTPAMKTPSLQSLLQTSRKSVLDWLFNISTLEYIELRPHTIFLGIELFDRVMHRWDTNIDEMKQLKYISIACLDIASKFLEIYPIDLQRVYEYNNKQHYMRMRKEYEQNPQAFPNGKPIPPRITRDDIKEFIMKVNKYEQKILHLLDFLVFTSNPFIRNGENYEEAKREIYYRLTTFM